MLRNCFLLLTITFYEIFAYPDTINEYEIRMPGVKTKQDDEYWCYSKKIPDETLYITKFEPIFNPAFAHHMILFTCEKPGTTEHLWKCGEMSDAGTPVCEETGFIVFAWAMGAPSFELPKDVSFKVGQGTPNKYFVLQVHYKGAMDQESDVNDSSGLKLTVQSTPTEKLAGVYTLVSGEDIGPHQTAQLTVACSYTGKATLHPFAFRVHAHEHGIINKGFVSDGKKTYLIGSMSPQAHQTFYPVKNESLEINNENIIAAKCIMQNNESRIVRIGNTQDDEMCNFYIMYWVTSENEQQLYDENNQVCYTGDTSEILEKFDKLREKIFDDSLFKVFPDFKYIEEDSLLNDDDLMNDDDLNEPEDF
ncbi:putative peptidylglycine alpha-hydroxylating monooxygenase 1 [Schistosoma japonicum]|nr:putative peptidylglycine alpha-hydroxylating monooxygenase 1 [Schistosoma japonicum]